jgi:hypothetical protein
MMRTLYRQGARELKAWSPTSRGEDKAPVRRTADQTGARITEHQMGKFPISFYLARSEAFGLTLTPDFRTVARAHDSSCQRQDTL